MIKNSICTASGKIIPEDIAKRAIQYRDSLDPSNKQIVLNGMFTWSKAEDRFNDPKGFWSKINRGNFDVFYERYSKNVKIDNYSII